MKRMLAIGLILAFVQYAGSLALGAETVHSLREYGEISTPKEAEVALQKGLAELEAAGGGILIIPADAPKAMEAVNTSQTDRNAPGVTIVDLREGFIHFQTPQLGKHQTGLWAGVRYSRKLNLGQKSITHCGVYPNQTIQNYSISGCSSYMNLLAEDAKAGTDAKCYVESIVGLWVGQWLNVTGSVLGYGNPFDRITIKQLGWDDEKKMHYFVCDLEHDHPAGALVYNKHVVNNLQIDDWSNCANQSMSFQAIRRQYSNGDSFVVSAMLKYMGQIMSGYGDEMGVVVNAESVGEVDGFHSTVEAVDWSKDEIAYAPGKVNAHTLSDQRPLINMNQEKWHTAGTVRVVPPDDWYGMFVKDPQLDEADCIRYGIDLAKLRLRFMEEGKEAFGLLTFENLPVHKLKYTYKGRAYPSILGGKPLKNQLGGAILGSPDCGWTPAMIGRFFALTDPGETLLPEDGNCGYAQAPKRPCYRWYMINGFFENPDGTKVIKILRIRWAAVKAGAPILFNDDNYTWDGHERPMKYAIAPGAWVYSVAEGWQDALSRGGATKPGLPRKIRVSPSAERGTELDFAVGDPIEQVVAPDPWHPVPVRIRQHEQLPTTGSGGSIEVHNNSRVQIPHGIVLGGGPLMRDGVAKRKDRKPSYGTMVDLHSCSNVGLVFSGDVLEAAIQFNQPRGGRQPIVWKNMTGEDSSLTVDPQSGDFHLAGGDLRLTDRSVVRQSGLSATDVAARNLRGIDVAVPEGATTLRIDFGDKTQEADGRYSITVQPSWFAMDRIEAKDAKGFTVAFSAPAPAGAKVDWQLIR